MNPEEITDLTFFFGTRLPAAGRDKTDYADLYDLFRNS
jgi:hypothetical protein